VSEGVVVLAHATLGRDPYAATMAEAEQTIAASLQASTVTFRPTASSLTGRARSAGRKAGNVVSLVAKRPEQLRAPVKDLPTGRADVAFLVSRHPSDLVLINHAQELLGPSTTLVVILTEVWPTFRQDPKQCAALSLLERAQLVIVNQAASVDPLREHLGRGASEVRFLPPALDLAAFTQRPDVARTVDVFAPGRRPESVHRALRLAADNGELHYVYDSVLPGSVPDFDDHRSLFISQVQRSRTMLSYPARLAERTVTGGAVEFGVRYFEAMAGGALPLGHSFTHPQYEEHLVQVPMMLPLGENHPDPLSVLNSLSADDESAIRHHNKALVLGMADWSHRLQSIYRYLGQPMPGSLECRLSMFEDLQRAVLSEGCAAMTRSDGSMEQADALYPSPSALSE
jgi:hypothetical protein